MIDALTAISNKSKKKKRTVNKSYNLLCEKCFWYFTLFEPMLIFIIYTQCVDKVNHDTRNHIIK